MLLRSLLALGMIWGGTVWSQCQTNIDFNTWSQEGHGVNGNWLVQGGGTSVFQTINGDPTFYVSPDTFINVIIQGTIAINDNAGNPDDDFVGFVFGYQQPDVNPNQYDFWLFDWKAQDQTYNLSNNVGYEGYALTRVQGYIPQGSFNYLDAFWSRINSPESISLATNYGPGLGWNNQNSYDFTLVYTSTRVTIYIDNNVIFDLPGCFEAGRFGFYNYSQPRVRYSNFSYRLISNFELEDNSLEQCVGENVKFSFTDSSCTGSSSATDNIASWAWDFGDGSSGSTSTNPNHVFPDTGYYDVTLRITDVNGCQDSVSKTVRIHPSPIPTLGVSDSILCPQDSVQLQAGGGVTYKWVPATGLSDPNIANPMAFDGVPHDYQVNVYSQYGCVADTSVYVHFFEAEIGADTSICIGDTIPLTVIGGQQFDWTPSTSLSDGTVGTPLAFPTTNTTYEVFVTDEYNCKDTLTQSVSIFALPTVTLDPDTAVCTGEPVRFQANGALDYTWSDGAGNVLGIDDSLILNPTSTFNLILAGTDTNSCRAFDTTELIVHPLPIVEAGLDQGLCSHLTLTLGSASNPAGSYQWTPALGLNDPNVGQPTFTPTSTDTFQFNLTLTDLNGCVNEDSIRIWVSPFAMSANATDVPCFGEPGGSLSIVAQGSSPFEYSWFDGGGSLIYQEQTSADSVSLDSLFAGSYQVVTLDSLGCTDTLAFNVTEPGSPLSLTLSDLQDVDCFGNTTGEISVMGAGGTPAYLFSLDGGFTYQDSGRFVGLGASVYTVTAQDNNGCEATLTDTVRTPTGLFASLDAVKHIDCFGNDNGALTLSGTGGQAPYQVSLDGTNYSTVLQFNNLVPGQDTLWFMDANTCLTRVPFEIYEPDLLTLGLVGQRDVPCFGDTTGQIFLAGNGGTGDYQYSLDNGPLQPDSIFSNLSAGIYSVEVQDDSLCLAPLTVRVEEPPLLTLSVERQRNISCFGLENGAVTVDANGGSPGYLYALDTLAFGVDSTFTGFAAGNYQISVQDDSGCVTIFPIEITQPDSLILDVFQLRNVACFGDSMGEVHLTTLGGTQPYAFSVNGSSVSADSLFEGLAAGEYDFLVRDDSSCTDTVSVSISQSDSLILSLTNQTDIDCYGNDNGEVSVMGSGGVGPYSFRLDSLAWGGDTAFANLTPGQHLIELQDDSLCMRSLLVDIFEPEVLTSEVIPLGVACYGDQTGEAEILLTGGTQPYAVLWSTGDTGVKVMDLLPGKYQAQVVDANGCALDDEVEISQPDTLTLNLLAGSIVEAYCDWPNGMAAVETAGGVQPHTVTWEGENTLEGFSVNQLFGDTTYQVSVTDANGCVTTITAKLPHTPPASVAFDTDPEHEGGILLSRADVQFVNLTTGAESYEWEFGDGGASVETSPIHTYADTGVYEVKLTANNSYQVCPVDTILMLHIIPDGSVFMPNAFTPNDDGVNDDFKLVYEGLVSCHWEIYDRWGKVIVSFDQASATWDGRSADGRPVPEGTYLIRLEAQLNSGRTYMNGGSVMVIR